MTYFSILLISFFINLNFSVTMDNYDTLKEDNVINQIKNEQEYVYAPELLIENQF